MSTLNQGQYNQLMANPAIVEAKTTVEHGFVKNIPSMQQTLQEVYSQVGGGGINWSCPCAMDDMRRLFSWVKEYEQENGIK